MFTVACMYEVYSSLLSMVAVCVQVTSYPGPSHPDGYEVGLDMS